MHDALKGITMSSFCHLHCHTSFSLLDGAARIDTLVSKAVELGMPALGITDHGNLYGVPEFYFSAKSAGIAPVIGCEFYLCDSPMGERRDAKRYHQVLWAKSEEGYRNLLALSSRSFLEGFYYKPRIDFDTLARHSSGLVATTCCLQGQVPQTLLQDKEKEARTLFEQYREAFGEDYYIELQNHGLQDQQRVNAILVRWAQELGVRTVATNDVHYVAQQDSEAQDVLLCLQTGKDFSDPTRLRFEGDQYYLKNAVEMKQAMAFLPGTLQQQSLETSLEIAEKCRFELSTGKLLMPHYPLPAEFGSDMDAYLKHMVFEGARKRWTDLNPDIETRINHELGIIAEMGYAGYFLIVEDFTTEARNMNVSVGPARGSAASSAVAYCLGITNIDPLKYDLLFERFLNPERVSMPDIDIDFDDRGRSKVIDYVIRKYGRENVCQIITFGSMGPKTAIRDVARVLHIPLSETDRIAKLIPEGPQVTLDSAFESVNEFRALRNDPRPEIKKLLQYAKVLEGSARHTSVHAAGVIIAPGKVRDYIPVAKAKNKDANNEEVLISQYDGNWVERFGLLKMDLLGLSTLTILEDARKILAKSRGIDLDLNAIPLDDDKTFEIFRRGDTTGVFQFDGDGMRRWLTELKPTCLDDLIAMNALFRPGPMDLIPSYIRRKHGEEKANYLHPMLKPVLERTFGIPVYQEQVMQMAQVMGGYTLGGADVLRRAMGKKKKAEMARQRTIFLDGATKQDVDAKTANEVFDLMDKFAGYGFNKSHSTAYSLLAYQTAYLKANYAPEFMAAVMSHPNTSARALNTLRSEALRRGINLLPPSIYRSHRPFTVENGHIRFGLCAVKGVQRTAIDELVQARKAHGKPRTLYDFLGNLDLKKVNDKTLENLARVGALDDLEGHRAQLLKAIKPAVQEVRDRQARERIGQFSLFGEMESEADINPPLPMEDPWPVMQLLKEERELTGIYISGHPLDEFEIEARSLATAELGDESLAALENGSKEGRSRSKPKVAFCGIITKVRSRTTRKNQRMLTATLEDYTGTGEIIIFPNNVAKFEALVTVEAIVLAKGDLQLKGGNVEILATDILPMRTVREQKITSVVVRLDAAQTSEADIASFQGLCKDNRGQCSLYIDLVDGQAQGGYLRLRSRSVMVRPSADLLQGLGRLFDAKNVSVEASLS